MDRRNFNRLLGCGALGTISSPLIAKAGPNRTGGRSLLYNSIGSVVTQWEVDPEAATLTRLSALELPSVVQYGWPHPNHRFFYVATTDSERGSKSITGSGHFLFALRNDPKGGFALHGPARKLRQRPIHTSVDHSGRFILCAYNAPANVSVHAINADGTLGEEIVQHAALDTGVFAHQILTTHSNQAAILATRGNNPGPEKPLGDPGALKLFHFNDGQLSPYASITVGGRDGYGYGPRHLDFHPRKPWIYVLVELQNQLHMHRMAGDLPDSAPAFITPSTQGPMQPGIVQVAGAIHVHPRGHVVYASNRVSATTHPIGAFPFEGGENNIAVFAIDQESGEPRPIQFADPHGFHVRAFTIDPTGRLLIAACLAAMSVKRNGQTEIVPAGLSLFRIADDGSLEFARRYDIDLEVGVQQMWTRAIPIANDARAKAP